MVEDLKKIIQAKKYAGVTSTHVSIATIDYLINEIERLDSLVIKLRTEIEIMDSKDKPGLYGPY